MTSMLCRKETGGQVHVHDNDLIERLAVDDKDNIRTLMMSKQNSAKRRRLPRPNTTPSPSRSSSRNMDTSSLIGQTMRVQHWLNEKTVKTLQEKSDLESKAARQLYSPLLQTESTFVKDVEDYITQREVTNLRKKEVLHKNWSERVYKPLRKKIIEAMDSNDWPEVDRRKRELHRQYLEFTNEKGHVFLDTMDPEEYYAMALNGHRPAPIKDEKSDEVKKCVASQIKREKLFRKEIQKMEKFIKTTIFIRFDGSQLEPEVESKHTVYKHIGTLSVLNEKTAPSMCAHRFFSVINNGVKRRRFVAEQGKRQFSSWIQIETRPLHDPLISQGRQRSEEDRTILRCMTGYRYSDKDIEQVKMPAMPLVPLGRHGTDSIRWLKMPLENIESSPRLASRRRMRGKFNDTGIDFGEWTKAPYNHAEVDRELQIQKKRQYPEDQRPPFPKPVIQKVTLKPIRNVSFHEPVVHEPESLAVQPVTQAMQKTNIGVGTD